MNAARKGNGIDRHLFGLWCAAFEENLDVPALYSDPLYSKRYILIFNMMNNKFT